MSPVLQFAHLTCVHAVLDDLRGSACIHVLDFDIGMGGQWASLMQELALGLRAHDASGGGARRLSYAMYSGMTPVDGFVFDSGGSSQMIGDDMEMERGNGRAAKNKEITMVLYPQFIAQGEV
ncbi:hypothetical protein QYE76_061500 [Lolium multiflorum]|uniref:Uncharacterized protein n=1 Tax=Lolium multiflorum TaxID=4521 RepID=A0AAD8S3B8_LOLMU|nr:hypothetical protein QYE76_061500 [Lolium multiflorum]